MRRKRLDVFYKQNDVSKRIAWLRSITGLTTREISSKTGIPKTSYIQMETSSRTTVYEYLFVLSDFFNKQLSKKFTKKKPTYEGVEVLEVTLEWLMFGHNVTIEKFISKISEIEKDFTIQQIQMLERQFDLENRIKELDHGNARN